MDLPCQLVLAKYVGYMPDYACLIVGANMGIVGMCKEHMGVALALKVPVFFVITKVRHTIELYK